jgi:hypothetical protein
MDGTQRPIGWWLKQLDARIEASFDAALADVGVDRRRWQIRCREDWMGEALLRQSRLRDDCWSAAVPGA